MKGFLYKDFYNSKVSIVTISILQAIISILLIWVSFASKGEIQGEDSLYFDILFVASYFLMFLLSTNIFTDFFKRDEIKLWKYYLVTVPNGIEDAINSKYVVMIISQIFVSVCCFMTDITCNVINSEKTDYTIFVTLFLGINIVKMALQIPGMIYFGVNKGNTIGNLVLSVLFFLGVLYALFGDISMFLDRDIVKHFMEMLTEGLALWIFALMPFVTIALYWLSNRLTIKNYRKGVDREND